jgi:hypothetical protein
MKKEILLAATIAITLIVVMFYAGEVGKFLMSFMAGIGCGKTGCYIAKKLLK